MTSKSASILKRIGVGLIVLFGIVSCEKDLEDIAVDLAGQRPFDTGDTIFEIIAYHNNVDSSRVDNNETGKVPLGLFGASNSNRFGLLEADLLSQLHLPLFGADFGQNAIIDRVVVDFPYFSTLEGQQAAVDPDTGEQITDENGDTIPVPWFSLDSVYGNENVEYEVRFFELGTFLNTLDPIDPTQPATYYSDKEYSKLEELHRGNFKPNANDTVLYVERRYLDDDPNTVDDIDTIKAETVAPSMKFDLDKDFFKRRFVDHDNPTDFDNNDNFVRYFRGLFMEAAGMDGSVMNLRVSDATMTIYYTNEVLVNEGDGEDLNGNGIEGESSVYVKRKQTMQFTYAGVRTGVYRRNYGGSAIEPLLINPNVTEGEERLYVHGAAGSEIIIDLFDDETLEELRADSRLINEANLVFYVDGIQSNVPQQLFIYKKDFHSLTNDYWHPLFGPEVFGGILEYDDDGEPEKYKFRITKYMTELLRADEPIAPSKLALKNWNNTDQPDFSFLDTIINDWNYSPKGVVLHGNRPEDNSKRIKLEIYYSK